MTARGNRTILILADDPEFARSVMARWQVERYLPTFTLAGSSLGNGRYGAGFDLVIIGPLGDGGLLPALTRLEAESVSLLALVDDDILLQRIRSDHPRTLALTRHDGWVDVLVLLGAEMLRRRGAEERASDWQRAAAMNRHHAMLGRYMLEMRHSLNNALTSVLGNAELLLLEPGAFSAELREQMETIRAMAMRMHEVLQRFSSLEMEMSINDGTPGRGMQAEAAMAVQS